MKIKKIQLEQIIAEEIGKYLNEAGASQLIGAYNIDVITEDKECIYAFEFIKKYVDRRSGWQFSIPEYAQVSNLLSEGIALVDTIIQKRVEQRDASRLAGVERTPTNIP
jgi:hypothetical protein